MADDGLDRTGLQNDDAIDDLFQGITPFNMSNPFDKQRCMTYRRSNGKILEIFKLGPLSSSRIYTMEESWPSIGGMNLSSIRDALIDNKLYGIATVKQNEGATIWGFRVNKKWADKGKEGILKLNELIEADIKSRRWNTAISKAYNDLEDKQQEGLRTLFLASISYQKDNIPFFGRTAFGLAYANHVISLTEIPLMVSSNRNQYFTWSFVPKDSAGIRSEEDLYSKFVKGGGEKDYDNFVKIRDFLIQECEPLNSSGTYKDVGNSNKELNKQSTTNNSNKEDNIQDGEKEANPIQQASDELNKESINRSFFIAESFAKKEYRLITEVMRYGDDDDEEELDSPTTASNIDIVYPKGLPTINKLTLIKGIPVLGPLY